MSTVRILVILNDPPYGTERSYNGLRVAHALAEREETAVRVFMLADSVGCALAGQKVPDGSYNLGRMIEALGRRGAEVGLCGTCLDARGVTEDRILPTAHRSTLEGLAEWTLWVEGCSSSRRPMPPPGCAPPARDPTPAPGSPRGRSASSTCGPAGTR